MEGEGKEDSPLQAPPVAASESGFTEQGRKMKRPSRRPLSRIKRVLLLLLLVFDRRDAF